SEVDHLHLVLGRGHQSHMDYNIGLCLWKAAEAVSSSSNYSNSCSSCNLVEHQDERIRLDPESSSSSEGFPTSSGPARGEETTPHQMDNASSSSVIDPSLYQNYKYNEDNHLPLPAAPGHDDINGRTRSRIRVVLVGHGADELLAGYARHVSKRPRQSRMFAEMLIDLERFWQRNLGRDDRVISDWGLESRHPFLGKEVVDFLAGHAEKVLLPDKQILRSFARNRLELKLCANLDKRAIQFGTGIAKISNRREFGSNRKANGRAQKQFREGK
ncbi:unnamed protein product, partial [Amoebophrya sp. A25]